MGSGKHCTEERCCKEIEDIAKGSSIVANAFQFKSKGKTEDDRMPKKSKSYFYQVKTESKFSC